MHGCAMEHMLLLSRVGSRELRLAAAPARQLPRAVLAGPRDPQGLEPPVDCIRREQHGIAQELAGGGQSCRRKGSVPSCSGCR